MNQHIPIVGAITYILAIPDHGMEELSPFQLFTRNLFPLEPAFYKLLHLPSNILELASARDSIIASRIYSRCGYRIRPVAESALTSALFPPPFVVLVRRAEASMLADEAARNHTFPILQMAYAKEDGMLSLEEADRDHIRAYVKKVASTVRIDGADPLSFDSHTQWITSELSTNSYQHNSTTPSQMALTSVGFLFQNSVTINPLIDQQYIDALTSLHDEIQRRRTQIIGTQRLSPYLKSPSLVIDVPSLVREIYQRKKPGARHKKRPKNGGEAGAELAIKMFSEQRHYSSHVPPEHLAKIMASETGRAIVQERSSELNLHTAAVTVECSSHFAPSLRLAPEVNHIRSKLRMLRQCVGSNSPKSQLSQHKIFKDVQNAIASCIPNEFLSRMDRPGESIRLISDMPLEWVPIRGLPLGLRSNVSRIPTTPGDLLLRSCLNQSMLLIQASDLSNILIVNAFHPDDKLEGLLRRAVGVMEESVGPTQGNRGPASSITWRNVLNKKQFIEVLNAFNGGLMVFDGHGSHDNWRNTGDLWIGSNKINLWELGQDIRIPPIVLLSACDTHPADASHASTANAFLAGGAISVLGSLLPLEASRAAVMIARLIFRLRMFIDIMIRAHSAIDWTTVISGMLRMSHASETLDMLQKKRVINFDEETWKAVHLKTTNLINPHSGNWYESMIEFIATAASVEPDTIRHEIDRVALLTEANMYTHLGAPHRILITQQLLPQNSA
jgi:hypothetical protein